MAKPYVNLTVAGSDAPLVIKEFGGETDNLPLKAEDGQASTILNLYHRRNYLQRRGGTAPLGSAVSPDQDQQLLKWARIFQNGVSTEYLLGVVGGTVVDWFAGTPGTAVASGTSRLSSTATDDCDAAWVDQKVYVSDGKSGLFRWNGTSLAVAVPPQPAVPTAATNGAGNLTGVYQWLVTFIGVDGADSEPSSGSNILSLTGQKATLTLPVCPTREDGMGRRIWRTGGIYADFRLVGTVTDNNTTTFSDNVADTALGVSLLLLNNTRMPPCKFLVEWQNRLVGAGCSTPSGDLQTIYLSNYRQPWNCPVLPNLGDNNLPPADTDGTRLVLQDAAAGQITALCPHSHALMVWTAGAGFMVQGIAPSSWSIDRFSNVGCVAHRTAVSYRHFLCWLGPDGVYLARPSAVGYQVDRISDDLYDTFLALPASGMACAWAMVWDDKYFLTVPGSWTRVYDFTSGNWGKLSGGGWDSRVGTVTTWTGTKRQRIYTSLRGHAQAWQCENGTATDNGTAIATTWASRDFDMAMPGHEKRLHAMGAKWAKSTGTASVSLYRGTGELIQLQSIDLASGTRNSGSAASVTTMYQEDVEQARDEHLRLQIDSSTTDPNYQLLEVDLFFTVAD